MHPILLKSVNLFDPEPRGLCDLFLCGGIVAAVGKSLSPALPDVEVVDGSGLTALPGLVDQHVHFTGGGGECGFRSRVPELSLTDFTTAGVTTAVGLLGTDSATRSPKSLLAKTKALNEEGITAYCLTGAYDVPSPTVTGSLKDDVAFISEILGVKVALSDHRSGHPSLEQLIHMASQVRLGALTAGKPGVVHIHMGAGKRGLGPVYDLLEATDLPIWHFRPTHMGRWQKEAAAFARQGGMVDFTAGEEPEKCALPVLRTLEEAPPERITISSDAGGSMPRWSEDRRAVVGMGVGSMRTLLPVLRCLVTEHHVPLETAVCLATRNVADGLYLSRKGRLTVGADGDVLLLDRDWNVHTVLARGVPMVAGGVPVKLPYLS